MFKLTLAETVAITEASSKTRIEQNLAAIEALVGLKSSNRQPTQTELRTLALFNGWGSCAGIFTPAQVYEFAAQDRLKRLLTTEEYEKARESIVNAHYTSPEVITGMWHLLGKAGFKGGRILEPSMGTGFFYGLMPESVSGSSELFGIELEPIPAKIASYLYPEANVYNQGFETVELPEEYFDLVVGNVPFGDYQLADPKYDALNLSIHNYFIAKSIDLLRDGGLLAVITSPYTMDSKTKTFREYIAKRAELIAAIRLPNTAFKDVANTEVSADILIFQKRAYDNSVKMEELDWIESINYIFSPYQWEKGSKERSSNFNINYRYSQELRLRASNIYYENQPQYQWKGIHHLLGKPSINKLYGNGFALADDGRDLLENIKIIPVPSCFKAISATNTDSDAILLPANMQGVKDSSFVIYNNKAYTRDGAYLRKSNVPVEKVRCFQELYNLTLMVIAAQKHLTDDKLEDSQLTLKGSYTNFVREYGQINHPKNIKDLGQDPCYFLTRSLEKVSNKKVIGLSDIFTKRVIKSDSFSISEAKTVEDAITASLNAKGKLDYAYMSQLLSKLEEELINELSKKEFIYYNPAIQQWEQKDKYLSGNVYAKLQAAKAANLTPNIEALKKVQPLPALPNGTEDMKLKCIHALGIDWEATSPEDQARILSKKIDAKLGTIWIPEKFYKQFAKEVMSIHHLDDIRYIAPPVASWYVDPPKSTDTQEFGTGHLSSAEILTKCLNLQEVKVVIYSDGEVDREGTVIATTEAQGKATLIKQAFLDWIWADEERCVELCHIYNTKINVYRSRKYDGSWLKLPGLNPEIKLRPWQLNAVARIIENPATFLAHDVGLGKTFVMVCGIMELRRLGIVHKPMLVCLNGTEGQFYDDFMKCYPLANVLIAGKMSNAEDRKLFTSSLKTGDFDAVILTHSQFFELSLSKEYQVQFLTQEREMLNEFLSADENKNPKSIAHKMIRSALEKCEDSLLDVQYPELATMKVEAEGGKKRKLRKHEKKEIKRGKSLDSLNLKILDGKRKHTHLDFEGITDCLVIDEIHQMKNLVVLTKLQNIRGIPTGYSQRATDTYTKLLYVLDNLINSTIQKTVARAGRAIGATGTIFSNTIAEIYNWQRMFSLPLLKELGIDYFDAWVSQFAEAVSSSEISPENTFRVKTRLKKFSNLSILHATMSQFVDIVTFDSVGNNKDYGLVRPEARYVEVIAPASESQMRFLSKALVRATAIRNGDVDPTEDNFLKLTTDLTKAALSMRLLGDKEEAQESKLHDVAHNIVQIYKATESVKGTQLAFCDFSTPKNVVKTVNKISILLRENHHTPEHIRAVTEQIENLAFLVEEELDDAIAKITDRKYLHGQIKNIVDSGKTTVYSVYTYIKDLLVRLGIPESQIEFIHDHNGVRKRTKLFDKVNTGEVRILLGSTSKLGTGCNVHKNGVWALHHIDAPWRPSDIAQREGRGIRQLNGENRGKTLGTCLVFRYITERLDALRWQTLQWKQECNNSFLNGADIDSIEDGEEGLSLSFSQVFSLVTGNPLLIEESNLQNELNALLIQERAHKQGQLGLKSEINRLTVQIKELLEKIDKVELDIAETAKYPRLTHPKQVSANETSETFRRYSNALLDLNEAKSDAKKDKDNLRIEELRAIADQIKLDYDNEQKEIDAVCELNEEETKKINKEVSIGFSGILKDAVTHPELVATYRGLEIYAACMWENLMYSVRGKSFYYLPFKLSGNKQLTMNRSNAVLTLDRLIDALPDYLAKLTEELEIAKNNQNRSISMQGREFPQASRLNEVQNRLLEIREALAQQESIMEVAKLEEEQLDEDGNIIMTANSEFWLADDTSSSNTDIDTRVISDILSREESSWIEKIIQPQLKEYEAISLAKSLNDAVAKNSFLAIAKIYRSCSGDLATYWQDAFSSLDMKAKTTVLKVLSKLVK